MMISAVVVVLASVVDVDEVLGFQQLDCTMKARKLRKSRLVFDFHRI